MARSTPDLDAFSCSQYALPSYFLSINVSTGLDPIHLAILRTLRCVKGSRRAKNGDQNSPGVTNGAPDTENRFRHSVRRLVPHAIPITLDHGTNLRTERARFEAATGTRSPILDARREGLLRLSRSQCLGTRTGRRGVSAIARRARPKSISPMAGMEFQSPDPIPETVRFANWIIWFRSNLEARMDSGTFGRNAARMKRLSRTAISRSKIGSKTFWPMK